MFIPQLSRSIQSLHLFALALVALTASGCVSNEVLEERAVLAMKQGDYVNAERHLNRAIKQDDTDWAAYWRLGQVRVAQGRPREGQIFIEQALNLRFRHEETPAILDSLAESIDAQNRPDDLKAMLERATQDYGTPRDYIRQARFLMKHGDMDGAELAMAKAQRISGNTDPSGHIAAGEFYESVGRTDQAILAYRRAYAINPDKPTGDKLRRLGFNPSPSFGLPSEN